MDSAVIIGRPLDAAPQQEVPPRGGNWQDECAEISRQKARRHRRMSWRRRMLLGVAIMVPAYLGLGAWWLGRGGHVEEVTQHWQDWFYDQTRAAGFEVKHIAISGAKQLSPQMVAERAGVKLGDATLQLQLSKVRRQIESLPEVRSAHVRREFPDRIYLSIVEREPSAVWQHQGKAQWVDQDGTVLVHQSRPVAEGDLLIRGTDAPNHMQELLEVIRSEEALRDQVVAATRVGKRRWNVQMTSGMVVLLPAQQPKQAWHALAAMQTEQQILDRAIKQIDLRIEDRVFLLPEPLETNEKAPAMTMPPAAPATTDTSHDT